MEQPQQYTIEIHAVIRPKDLYLGGLEIRESATVDAAGFMELCQILGKFHELVEVLRARPRATRPAND